MTVKERTQVGIVGAGPTGLLLPHLLAPGGIEARVMKVRSWAHCEARQRMLAATGPGRPFPAWRRAVGAR